MKAWWIIPNRDQRDDILASDGHAIRPLKEILDPALRPAGFSHGVPGELIQRCGIEAAGKILFAQKFPRWDGNKQLFLVATPAGVDSSGRFVHLGLLFILDPQERPRFDLPCAALSAEDQAYARTLMHRMLSPARHDSWAQSVRELAELAGTGGPVTNVALYRSAVPFDFLYDAGPNGLTRKSRFGIKRSMAAIALIVLLAGAWLYERACDPHMHPTACSGGVIWRLS